MSAPPRSADRQSLDVLFLRQVRPDPDRVAARANVLELPTAMRLIFCAAVIYRSSSVGERSPTVTLSNPWLDSSFGRSRGGVDVDRQQVADGILILGPIEPSECIGTTGLGMLGGGAVERAGKRGYD